MQESRFFFFSSFFLCVFRVIEAFQEDEELLEVWSTPPESLGMTLQVYSHFNASDWLLGAAQHPQALISRRAHTLN